MTLNFTPSVISRAVVEHGANTMKFVVVLVCVVIEIQSERTRSGVCKGCQFEEYTRVKRPKYYTRLPLKFYNRPHMTYSNKDDFFFTPPPGYLMENAKQTKQISNHRPTNEGLADEDINNIMRFLSKQDLDKIVEFANEKERESQKYTTESLYQGSNYITDIEEKYQNKVMYNDDVLELNNDNKFSPYGSFINAHEDLRPYSIDYNNPNINELKSFRFRQLEPSELIINKNKLTLNTQFDSDRVMQNQQFSNFNPYSHQEANQNRNGGNIFSDSSILQEEQLPKPSNLRGPDFEVSYTNHVPTVVKADANSYKIENLGALPLMNYHSKQETVDSYEVPHYTVTSPEKQEAPASSANIPVEAAPPASTAHEQSDAHLKATKIWTHKSKGTAYTLHDDGTLSLE